MSQFSLLLTPFSCISFLVCVMSWNHTTSQGSRILRWRSSGWHNVVGCGCVLMFLWVWKLLIVGKKIAMGLRGSTIISLLASGNCQNDPLWIASVIHSQKTHGRRWIKFLPLMILIIKALCLSVIASTIPVLLLSIQRYRISSSLLLPLLLLVINIWGELKSREGGIIGQLGVTAVWVYLMERYVWR